MTTLCESIHINLVYGKCPWCGKVISRTSYVEIRDELFEDLRIGVYEAALQMLNGDQIRRGLRETIMRHVKSKDVRLASTEIDELINELVEMAFVQIVEKRAKMN